MFHGVYWYYFNDDDSAADDVGIMQHVVSGSEFPAPHVGELLR